MKVAFLEDDQQFATEVITALQTAGNEVHHFISGNKCLKAVTEEPYDLILLDWIVPDLSGTEILSILKTKEKYPPVVFLTARESEQDVIAVMNAGADDYIIKPPNLQVLLSRLNALHRRANLGAVEFNNVSYGRLSIDFVKRKFMVDQLPVKMTEKEIDLAVFFFKQIGVTLSRTHLSKAVWGATAQIDTRTMDVHISHLRSKLNLRPEFGWRLISVYQQGYRLELLE